MDSDAPSAPAPSTAIWSVRRRFPSRAEAVRAGIRLLEGELREMRVATSYRAAYATAPLSAEEARVLDAAVALAGDAIA